MGWTVKYVRNQQCWTAKAWARGPDGKKVQAEQYGYPSKAMATAVAIDMEAQLIEDGRTS